jgi:hypothetical protein
MRRLEEEEARDFLWSLCRARILFLNCSHAWFNLAPLSGM